MMSFTFPEKMPSNVEEEYENLKMMARSQVGRSKDQEEKFRELQKEKTKIQDKKRAQKNYDKMSEEQKKKKKDSLKEKRANSSEEQVKANKLKHALYQRDYMARLKEKDMKVFPPHLLPI